MQGRQGRQFAELVQQSVVDDRRPVKIGAAVHHPVTDRHESEVRQALPARRQHLEGRSQRRLVVSDSAIDTDAFDDAVD